MKQVTLEKVKLEGEPERVTAKNLLGCFNGGLSAVSLLYLGRARIMWVVFKEGPERSQNSLASLKFRTFESLLIRIGGGQERRVGKDDVL